MSVAATVRDYLASRPAVQEALAMGIINLSALSRRIADETGVEADMAIQAACRRYRAPRPPSDDRVERLLESAQLDVRTRMAVLTARRSWSIGRRLEDALRRVHKEGGTAHVIHGSQAVTIILDQPHLDGLVAEMDHDETRSIRSGLAQLNVRTASDVEDVPGVLFRIVGVLSARGINCIEVLACHKDNLFLVGEQDLPAALDALGPVLAGPSST